MVKNIKAVLKNLLTSEIIESCLEQLLLFNLPAPARKIISHNKILWRNFKVLKPTSIIICDLFYVPETLIMYSYFCNILAKKTNSEIKNYIWGNNLKNLKYSLIYKSFNCDTTIRIKLNKAQKKQILAEYSRVISSFKTKTDVLNYEIEGAKIGVDIYESYLREYNKATLDLADPRFNFILKCGISLFYFWNNYFSENSVRGLVVSHDNYIWMNIGCKVAYKFKIPVYLPNPRSMTFAQEPFSVYKYFKDLPELFSKLTNRERLDAIKIAREQYGKRFSGEIGVDMYYSTASSFGKVENRKYLKESNAVKVLIATHCFYDNPHAYEMLPFPDFYEWLNFLGGVSNETNYDWYIKVHPDPLPGTLDIVERIVGKYPRIKTIPYNVSHHQLINEGIDFVLTCYGTIGEEYPYFGKQVINTGYNPRIAYKKLNWHAETIKEYKEMLFNLKDLHLEIDQDELMEFYYMNHYFNWSDDLLFNSYREFLSKFSGNQQSFDVFTYFLHEFSVEKSDETISKIEEFIRSGKTNYFSIGSV